MNRHSALLLCLAVAAISVLGVIMLASTSVWIEGQRGDYGHVWKQIMWFGLGVVALMLCAWFDYRLLAKHWLWILLGTCAILALCYVPGVGVERNGETRWIYLPGLGQFQPSEPAKIGIILGIAGWFARYQAEATRFWKGFVMPMLLLGVPVALIFFEKDMGTSVAIGAAGFCVIYAAGTRLPYLILSVILAGSTLSFFVYTNANRMARIMAFMNMEDPEVRRNFGWQQYRGIVAFMSGGLSGQGLGNGSEKHGYLPFAHTDFIFAAMGEEMGLIATLGIVLCFVMVTLAGMSITMHAPDHFGRLLGLGLTAVIIIPALMNIGVVTGSIPNTGLPLPFMSYGGSNLLFTLCSIGLLLSIHRRAVYASRTDLPLTKQRRFALKI